MASFKVQRIIIKYYDEWPILSNLKFDYYWKSFSTEENNSHLIRFTCSMYNKEKRQRHESAKNFCDVENGVNHVCIFSTQNPSSPFSFLISYNMWLCFGVFYALILSFVFVYLVLIYSDSKCLCQFGQRYSVQPCKSHCCLIVLWKFIKMIKVIIRLWQLASLLICPFSLNVE